MNLDLANRVALVTGASRGIGRAIALALARAGADVAVVATEARNGEGTVAEIERLGRRAVALGARVERAAEVEAAFADAEAALGPVAILVNNAGLSRPKSILEMTEADWDLHLDVNAKSIFLCSRRAARRMIEEGLEGSIINIGSIAGRNAFPGRLGYCASKAAIHQMTRVMAIEWATHRIRVNCLAPGYIRTELIDQLIREGVLDAKALERRIPEGRLGQVDEVAGAAVYLASAAATYVTGSVLLVDGGWDAYGFV